MVLFSVFPIDVFLLQYARRGSKIYLIISSKILIFSSS